MQSKLNNKSKIGDINFCLNCNKEFVKNSSNHRCCSIKCRNEYYNKTRRNKYRLIAEEKLNRKLKPNEVVHHIEMNDNPNKIFIVENQSKHRKIHIGFNKLCKELLDLKIIYFDYDKEEYKIN